MESMYAERELSAERAGGRQLGFSGRDSKTRYLCDRYIVIPRSKYKKYSAELPGVGVH